MHTMGISIQKLDYGEDKIFGLVQGVENFVLGDSDGGSAGDAALYFQKAQAASIHVAAFDVVAEFFEFAVSGFETELALDLHHDSSRASSRKLSVYRLRRLRQRAASNLGDQSGRNNDEATERYRRQRRDLSFEIELLHAFLEPRLQVVRPAPGFLGVETGVGFARLFLQFQTFGAMVPVTD